MLKKKIIIGTRGSKLALWQANHIASAIQKKHCDVVVVIQVIQTTGDRMQNMPLSQIGGKGLFTKEIEEEMLKGNVHLAVHSLKDVPTALPEGLEIPVITTREHPGDAFISPKYDSIDQLPIGAKVGTSSLRRAAQILHYRPDLEIVPLRGNVDTRLRKVDSGEMDAIILAVAGLHRLGWDFRIDQILPQEICLPAVGQGALALEVRSDDLETKKYIEFLNDPETGDAVTAERSFLRHLEGNCQVPFGVYGDISGGMLSLEGTILSVDGKISIREKLSGYRHEAEKLGIELAEKLASQGGQEIIESFRKKE